MSGARGWIAVALLVGACAPADAAREDAPELAPTRVATFGDSIGDGALSNVFGVAVSRDGRVFVGEPPFGRVVEYAADGAFVRVVAGPGEGPGELGAPGALTWRGDTLAVTELLRGISLYDDSGYRGKISFSVEDRGSPWGGRSLLLLADGSVAVNVLVPPSAAAVGVATRETWLRASRDGTVTDTLLSLALEGRDAAVEVGDRPRMTAHPLAWSPLLTAAPDGTSFVVVERPPASATEPATFRVVRVDPAGDTVAVASLPYDPVPVTDAWIDSVALSMGERWAPRLRATTPAAAAAAIERQIPWPSHHPPVTAVLAGVDGSVWLRREGPDGGEGRWEILGPALDRVGRVRLPAAFEPKVVALDHVYGVELDELDVPTIVRFDLSRVPGGGG